MKTKEVVIEPEKAYTKTAYSKAYNVSRPTIESRIKSKLINTIKINGATIILA